MDKINVLSNLVVMFLNQHFYKVEFNKLHYSQWKIKGYKLYTMINIVFKI